MGHYRAEMCCNDCGNYTCTCPKKEANKREVPKVPNPWNLSPMEWACMTRHAEGMTMEEVAKSLALSPKTVGTYSMRAREKMEQEPGKPVPMTRACVLIDRFIREGQSAVPQNFKVLIEMQDGQLQSRVIP